MTIQPHFISLPHALPYGNRGKKTHIPVVPDPPHSYRRGCQWLKKTKYTHLYYFYFNRNQ